MKNTVNYFWSWFKEHNSKFKNLNTLSAKERKHYMFWLDWQLHFYCPGIDFIMVLPSGATTKTQMIITANADENFFDKVEEVVKFAPKLKDWDFTAFVQPTADIDEMSVGLDKPFIYKDISIKASELRFMPFEYEGGKKIDMLVYLPNFTELGGDENLYEAVFIIIQDFIGEKSLAENINFFELDQLSVEEDMELIYLYDLPLYLDDIHNNTEEI